MKKILVLALLALVAISVVVETSSAQVTTLLSRTDTLRNAIWNKLYIPSLGKDYSLDIQAKGTAFVQVTLYRRDTTAIANNRAKWVQFLAESTWSTLSLSPIFYRLDTVWVKSDSGTILHIRKY